MSQRILSTIAAVLIVACGGVTTSSAQAGKPQPATAQAGSEAAVQGFLRAVADSNLEKMAELWGTSKGPASSTHQPAGYERRILVMQAYLHGADYRIISSARDGSRDDRRVLQVEMSRRGCDKVVPFTTSRTRNGWVVSAIDLDVLGSPGRECGEPDTSSSQ